MADYDVFNGDADGLCALHQLRLHAPRRARLVTGAKRDIALLDRIAPQAGDRLTVLDISLDVNRAALLRALGTGARCEYFDHHYPGEVPVHPALDAHIEYAPGTCTSLIVDRHLGGRHRAWAVVAAFGDNLAQAATAAAAPLALAPAQLELLRRLGECLNYNAYGESVADLHFHPEALYLRLTGYEDPLEFAARDSAFGRLQQGYDEDMQRAARIDPILDSGAHLAVLLPEEAWARRVSGAWANRLAQRNPQRAHAVMVRKGGTLRVSLRAPLARPEGADRLARQFAGGGGRPQAAGIDALPEEELPRLLHALAQQYPNAAA
jgi:hypothetical protein